MDAIATNDTPAPVDVERSRRRWLAPVIVVAIVAVATLGWLWTRPGTTRNCTLAASLPNPVATTPEGAFDVWWQKQQPPNGENWNPSNEAPRPPTRQDFTQVEGTRWEWRYTTNKAFAVDVGHPAGGSDQDAWTVVAVNRCTYGTT